MASFPEEAQNFIQKEINVQVNQDIALPIQEQNNIDEELLEDNIYRRYFESSPMRHNYFFPYKDKDKLKGYEIDVEKVAVKFLFFYNLNLVVDLKYKLKIINETILSEDKLKNGEKITFVIQKKIDNKGNLKNKIISLTNKILLSNKSSGDVIKKIHELSSSKTKREIDNLFHKYFLGKIAINVFEENPNIFKNKEDEDRRKKENEKQLALLELYQNKSKEDIISKYFPEAKNNEKIYIPKKTNVIKNVFKKIFDDGNNGQML